MAEYKDEILAKYRQFLPQTEAENLTRRSIRSITKYIESLHNNTNNEYIIATKAYALIEKINKDVIQEINDGRRIKDLLETPLCLIDKELINYRRDLDNKVTKEVEVSLKIFTCKYCGAKDHTYKEVQTRSIDEPKTIFCTCNQCGRTFTK